MELANGLKVAVQFQISVLILNGYLGQLYANLIETVSHEDHSLLAR